MISLYLFLNATFVIMSMKNWKRPKPVRRNLKMNFMILHQWFHENHMTLNPWKCHCMVIGSKDLSHEIMLNENEITSSNEEKLIGKLLDSKLNFESQLGSLYRKAGQKINTRLKDHLTIDQINLLLHFVIMSQFTYCPLICMLTSRYWNNASNNFHERVLRLICKDHQKLLNSILIENN